VVNSVINARMKLTLNMVENTRVNTEKKAVIVARNGDIVRESVKFTMVFKYEEK